MKSGQRVITHEGIQHLHGDLYRVKIGLLSPAASSGVENREICFINPRHQSHDGKSVAKGFLPEEMKLLRESIRLQGLNHPILARIPPAESKTLLQIVDGERRWRCIRKLISDGATCLAPDGEMRPAAEVYEYVDCRIKEMSDFDAYIHALTSSESSVPIGQGALILQVKYLHERGVKDEDILRAVHKDTPWWLKETYEILTLDATTFHAFLVEEIDRKKALYFAGIADAAKRVEVLEAARKVSHERFEKTTRQCDDAIADAQKKQDIALAEVPIVQAHGGDVKTAEKHAEHAAAVVEKKVERKKKVISRGPRVRIGDVREIDREGIPQFITKKKIQKFWRDVLNKIVAADGKDKNGNDLGIDLDDARLVLYLCEQMERCETDIVKILQDHIERKKVA